MNRDIAEIIIENENLIYSIISKYFNYYDKDDLYQVAVIGIINAYKNYNTSYDCKFTSYAYNYIKGEVYKYVTENRNLKLSRKYLQIGKRLNDAKDILTQKLMREPSIFELSVFLEIDETVIIDIINANNQIESLDKEITKDGKELYLSDLVANENNQYDIDKLLLYEEISKLSSREQSLLIGRYFEDKTQQELADEFGINQVQVSRNEKKILKKLNSCFKTCA